MEPDTPLPLPCCQHRCCAFLWHCVLSTVQCAVCSETVAFLCPSRTCSSLVCILSLADVCVPVSLFYGGCSDQDKSVFAVAILLLWLLEDQLVSVVFLLKFLTCYVLWLILALVFAVGFQLCTRIFSWCNHGKCHSVCMCVVVAWISVTECVHDLIMTNNGRNWSCAECTTIEMSVEYVVADKKCFIVTEKHHFVHLTQITIRIHHGLDISHDKQSHHSETICRKCYMCLAKLNRTDSNC